MAFIYDLTDTWNAGGTTFNAIKMNVTDTASAAASKLVTLQVGGSERFGVRKDGQGYFAGNVGIGTSAPATRLEVAASGSPTVRVNSTNAQNPAVQLFRTGGSGYQMVADSSVVWSVQRIDSSGTVTATPLSIALSDAATFAGVLRGPSGTAALPAFSFSDDTNTGVFRPADDTLALSTAGSERMRITSAGLVGIGTSAPTSNLHVNSSGNTILRISTSFTNSATTGIVVDQPGDSSQARIQYLKSGVSQGIFRFVHGATASDQGFDLNISNVNTLEVRYNQTVFRTGTSERMRIDSSGNVGIGTSAPNAALEVNGNIHVSGSDRSILNRSNSTLRLGANNTEYIFIQGNGDTRFFQNTTTDPGISNTTVGAGFGANGRLALSRSGGAGFFVNRNTSDGAVASFRREGLEVGTISVTTTATAYNTSSDYRLKDIDGPIQNSGAYIDALKPVQGSWKADGSRFIGLLAHEVQEVSETQIATGEKDGEEMQAMDYSAPEIIANLIAEIQSLRARVAQLEGN